MTKSALRQIRKRIVTDKNRNRVVVQIDYSDWLRVEHSISQPVRKGKKTNLSRHRGVISLTEDPVAYQARLRNEWS